MEPARKKQWTEEKKVTKVETNGSSVYSNTNAVPRAGDPPRTLHLGLTDGELANRIVVVGHPSRAELLAKLLTPEEPDGKLFYFASDRGFITHTGLFQGVRLSIVAIGMGLPMMDFFVREARAVVQGPMAVVRLGTCGVLQASVQPGGVGVATEGSVLVHRNYAAFEDSAPTHVSAPNSFVITGLCPPDAELASAVLGRVQEGLGKEAVVGGVNATADSFYCTQGREDPHFPDRNEHIIDELVKRHPTAVTMEMETYQLLHLARCCRPAGSIRAASAVVMVANRKTGVVANSAAIHAAERGAGKGVMQALAGLTLA